MTWLLIPIALVIAAALKVSRDQRANAAALRDQRVRFEAYTDAIALEREHAR
jgi:hypothetical protein